MSMVEPVMDNENREWVLRYPYRAFYSILQASYIMQRGTPQLYGEIRVGRLKAVTVDGKICIEHNELAKVIRRKLQRDPTTIKPYIPEDLKGVMLATDSE